MSDLPGPPLRATVLEDSWDRKPVVFFGGK